MNAARWLIALFLALGVIVIAIRLWSKKMEKGLVFFPERHIYMTPSRFGLEFEDVYFSTDDGVKLNGWFVPGTTEKVLLWFHGNGGNIADRTENIDFLIRFVGVSVFIFDYREYGRSEGEISKAGTFIDADAAFSYLVRERGIGEDRIVLFGRSLGSALAVSLASKHPVHSLIIESAFTSSDDVADLYYPFMKHLMKTSANYETSSIIGKIEVPKLIIHGERDEIIPLWMGEKLFELALSPKEMYIIPKAMHNDTYIVGGEDYFTRIKDFIER